jgi:hypothetical protein
VNLKRIEQRRFGRVFIRDERDDAYPMVKLASKRTSRYWNPSGWWGDQGDTPKCVGYAWGHWFEDGPITHRGQAPFADPSTIYALAQDLDEWPGSAYEGTSIRGGAKAMQQLGFISEYRWTKNLDVLISKILEVGPVVVGTAWWSDMCEPNARGIIRATGYVCGGHAWVVNGVNVKKSLFRMKNSWGRSWGRNGAAFVTFDDMAMLIGDMDGECCLAKEVE